MGQRLPQQCVVARRGDLTDEERDQLGKHAAKMAVLLKSPDRVQAVCADIAQHFEEKVAPNGFRFRQTSNPQAV